MPAHVISSEQQRDRMLYTPIPKLIVSLSVPTLASQLISVFYNTADTYFVSKLSTSASAAVGVVFSLMSIIQAFGFGIGMVGFLPMLLIVLFAFRSDEGLTLGNITSVLSNEIYMEVLGRSIWIALKATAICLILGYPIAYILSTMNKRKEAILYVLFIVPMWMNFLLRTYAWQVLLDSNGVLNTLLELLGLPSQQILYTEGAVMLGTVYNFLPFMVLPIYSVLVKLDRSLVEAAADLGANPITCFIKVVLPQSVPGIISGITMVFIPAITTFAISRLLGGGKFLLYGDLIENQFITLGQSAWPVGSALSFILLILVLLSMAVMRRAERDSGDEGGMLW